MTYRPTCVVRAPVATASGYGEMSRDIIRHLIELDRYDVIVHSINWGQTPMDQLNPDVEQDKIILDRIGPEQLERQPDVYISISVPTEFAPVGRYNIGITAGIETTQASPEWVDAMNRMDVNFVISHHSKNVFINSKYAKNDQQGNQIGILQCEKPIEVLHNCVDTHVYKKTPNHELVASIKDTLNEIPEEYCFLFVGHWLKGAFGHDRKSLSLLVHIFYDLFKRKDFVKKPALILKTSKGTYSLMDRNEILSHAREIRDRISLEDGEEFPHIYIIHGNLTDEEMNSLYNHPKVKTHITLTKGEGFGRPLLEASLSGKPIIAPGWSGQIDFLNAKDSLLIGGELKNVDESASWDKVIITDSKWLYPDLNMAAQAMVESLNNYPTWKTNANRLVKKNKAAFNYNKIKKDLWNLLDKYVPEFTEPAPLPEAAKPTLKLPKLKKKGEASDGLKLPKLKKKTKAPVKLPKLKKKEVTP